MEAMMFDVGTKIILIDSSHQKTTGPRKGSIGYIVNCSDFSVNDAIHAVTTICDVYFIRYGFEKHTRIERRSIISIIPILTHNPKETAYDQIKAMCSKLNSEELMKLARAKYDHLLNAVITMACPLTQAGADLITCEPNEFKAWILSHLENNAFENFIHNCFQSKHYTKYIDNGIGSSETWNTIIETFMLDKHGRNAFMDSILESDDARKRFINIFRMIAISCSNNRTRNKIGLGDFSPIRQDRLTLYRLICSSIFNKSMLRLYKATYMGMESDKAKSVVLDIEGIIQAYHQLANELPKSTD
jgi:hypothetical protein